MSRGVRVAYLVLAVLFVLAVTAQVFLAGLALFWRASMWETHVGVGHMIPGFAVLMLLLALFGRLPARMRPYTGLLFLGVALQAEIFVAVRAVSDVASAYHPVLAMVLFWGGLSLVKRSWVLVREVRTAPAEAVPVTPGIARDPIACDPASGLGCVA